MNLEQLNRAACMTKTDINSKVMAACRQVIGKGTPIYFAARVECVSYSSVYSKLSELKEALKNEP